MYKRILYLFIVFIILISQVTIASEIKSISEINDMYYNLSNSKLDSFKCQVTTDIFEEIKKEIYPKLNEEDRNEMKSIQFHLSYKDKNINFITKNKPDFSNTQINVGMKQIINGTKKMVTGFFMSWDGIVAEPIINKKTDTNFIIKKNKNGYMAKYNQGEGNAEIQFDQNYIIKKLKYNSENQKITILPKYMSTNEGLLVKELEVNINNGFVKEFFKVEYKIINNNYLPKKINTKIKMVQGEQNYIIKLFNYDVIER